MERIGSASISLPMLVRNRSDQTAASSSSDEVWTGRPSPRWATAACPSKVTATVRSATEEASTLTGTWLETPPSTSRRPLSAIGGNTPGIAIEARSAGSIGPELNHTSRRAHRSVATAVKGIGRSSIRCTPMISLTRDRTRSILIGLGPETLGPSSLSTSLRRRSSNTHSVNSGKWPEANRAPTTAPIEVPATRTT